MQALGVSRFTIEGQPGGRVVFSCLIPLAGRQAVAQRFEAEGEDALQAARAALRRVALWRAAQPQPAPLTPKARREVIPQDATTIMPEERCSERTGRDRDPRSGSSPRGGLGRRMARAATDMTRPGGPVVASGLDRPRKRGREWPRDLRFACC